MLSRKFGAKRAKLSWAAIAESLVRIAGVGPFGPLGNGGASFDEAGEVAQPDALLLEAAKKALDETIWPGRKGRDEFPAQPPIAAGGVGVGG